MDTALCFGSIIVLLFVLGVATIPSYFDVFAQSDAKDVYNNKSMTVPSNINQVVILIPDEAHESLNQQKDQYPFINQAYLPQNTIVSAGTTVVWFNADVDHDHKVTLTNEKSPDTVLFDSGTFGFGEASQPIVLNDTGMYNYYESNVNDNDRNFVMRGNVAVVSKSGLDTNSSPVYSMNYSRNSSLTNTDSAGVLMIPTQDIGNYIQVLNDKDFTTDSMYDFKDLRGGQKGTGDHQTLLLWTTSGINLNQAISALRGVVSNLPYS
jgi:plastocyanin